MTILSLSEKHHDATVLFKNLILNQQYLKPSFLIEVLSYIPYIINLNQLQNFEIMISMLK